MDRNNMSRPMFNNNDRSQNQNSQPTVPHQKRPSVPYLSQHDELVRFMHESWHKVTEQGRHAPTMYQNPTESRIAGFKPFDLENWWGRRALQNYHNINRSHNHQS